MSLEWDGRECWALVLGASSGFGAATAKGWARAGFGIIGVHLDLRGTIAAANAVRDEIAATGVPVVFHNVNAADDEKRAGVVAAIERLFEERRAAGERSHARGRASTRSPSAPRSLRHLARGQGALRRQLEMTTDVMAHSLLYWTRDLFHAGLLGRGSRVFAMTSEGAILAVPTYGAVSAAKAALEAHVRQLALELAPEGITVNADPRRCHRHARAATIPAGELPRARSLDAQPAAPHGPTRRMSRTPSWPSHPADALDDRQRHRRRRRRGHGLARDGRPRVAPPAGVANRRSRGRSTRGRGSGARNAPPGSMPAHRHAGARRDPLSREVKLLRLALARARSSPSRPARTSWQRRTGPRLDQRHPDDRAASRASATSWAILEALDDEQVEHLIRAFSLYFHLTNLAEEKHRVRRVRKRARTADRRAGWLGRGGRAASAACGRARATSGPLVDELSIGLVLTAHPTEARRRTMLVALRRVFALLDRLDDPRITPPRMPTSGAGCARRSRLLWRTSALRLERPTPLDEVRTALLFFDESLFLVTPRLYRALDRALDHAPGWPPGQARPRSPATAAARARARRPCGAFLRWGSWMGADRDGHARVTADDHAPGRGDRRRPRPARLEDVATRLMQTVAAAARAAGSTPGSRPGSRPTAATSASAYESPSSALSRGAVPSPLRQHRRAPAADAPPPRRPAWTRARLRVAG